MCVFYSYFKNLVPWLQIVNGPEREKPAKLYLSFWQKETVDNKFCRKLCFGISVTQEHRNWPSWLNPAPAGSRTRVLKLASGRLHLGGCSTSSIGWCQVRMVWFVFVNVLTCATSFCFNSFLARWPSLWRFYSKWAFFTNSFVVFFSSSEFFSISSFIWKLQFASDLVKNHPRFQFITLYTSYFLSLTALLHCLPSSTFL